MNARFKVSDVFGKAQHRKYHGPETLFADKEGYPYICASNFNNGVNKDMPYVNGNNLDLTPSKIVAWGKQCPMFCYHDMPCVTSQGMYFLDMTDYDESICLYVCGALSQACRGKYSYSNCLIGSKMDNEVISLPVIPSSDPSHTYTPADIDWQYMRDRITELERDRITELERDRITELDAYLKATGLDDYELTENDIHTLSLSAKATSNEDGAVDGDCGIRKKEFLMSEIFDIQTPAKKFNANTVRFGGQYPYVARGSSNNGIRGYINEDTQYLNPKRTFSFGQDTATVYFQTEPYFTGDKIKILVLRACTPSDEIAEYLICAVKKAFSGFSWGQTSFNENVLNNTKICLPVTSSGEPDWDYMEKYIRAIEKVVIADVVKWKNKEIEATKQIVNNAV